MKQVRLSLFALACAAAFSSLADAQTPGPGRLTAGIFGGGTIPRGDFTEEAGTGWHAGGLIKMRAYGALDVRLDGAYNKLAKKDLVGTIATVTTDTHILQGTLDALVNLGPDSAAYPGDNSVSPYLMIGFGLYQLDYDATCTGTGCPSFEDPGKPTHTGVNVGGGASIPLLGLRSFIEGRYHRIMRKTTEGQSRSMVMVSVGVKFR
jgi:opacity protein-like surface antigen